MARIFVYSMPDLDRALAEFHQAENVWRQTRSARNRSAGRRLPHSRATSGGDCAARSLAGRGDCACSLQQSRRFPPRQRAFARAGYHSSARREENVDTQEPPMAVTRSWTASGARASAVAMQRAAAPEGQLAWLICASLFVAAGLASVYAAKSLAMADADRLVNLNTVQSADQLLPLLESFPSGEERLQVAQRTFEYLERVRPVRNAGALSGLKAEAAPGQTAGQPAPGQPAPGQPAAGRASSAQSSPPQAAVGQASPAQTVAGQAAVGQAAPGQAAPGQAAPGLASSAQAPPRQTGRRRPLLPVTKLKPLVAVRTPAEFRREFFEWSAIYFAGFYFRRAGLAQNQVPRRPRIPPRAAPAERASASS